MTTLARRCEYRAWVANRWWAKDVGRLKGFTPKWFTWTPGFQLQMNANSPAYAAKRSNPESESPAHLARFEKDKNPAVNVTCHNASQSPVPKY